MEKNFYMDNFEQFLRDTTDEFRMYPSKRVWNSLYNNLHPGKKWPSFAVCLLLISSILFIGISHKNEKTGFEKTSASATGTFALNSFINKKYSSSSGSIQIAALPAHKSGKNLINTQSSAANQNHIDHTGIISSAKDLNASSLVNKKDNTLSKTKEKKNQAFNVESENIIHLPEYTGLSKNINKDSETTKEIKGKMVSTIEAAVASEQINSASQLTVADVKAKSILKQTVPANTKLTTADKEWIEDYAFHNKPKEKWKGRLAYQIYATPSVGYRSLTKTINNEPSYASSLITTTGSRNTDVQQSLNQYPALNLEAGSAFLYSLSKNVRLKAGLQINYTNYKIRAFALTHTTLTTLLLNDPNTGSAGLVARSSSIANTSFDAVNKKLNSNTYQLSLPVGADLKLLGSHRLQWYVGGTIQPSFIAGGNGYLISSDLKNYVYDASFLRKWNLNAAVESFLSYRMKNSMTLSAGPQLRYQFYSTYKSKYSYEEKLYNLGLKIGLSHNF